MIGYTRWHPRMRLNPFLRYINEYGLQFGYALIDDPENVPFNFFYTSNVSLPRELLLAEPFDLSFPYPAWEDIELSYRLEKGGMRLVYDRTATVAHDHPTERPALHLPAGEGGLFGRRLPPSCTPSWVPSWGSVRRVRRRSTPRTPEDERMAGAGFASFTCGVTGHVPPLGRALQMALHTGSPSWLAESRIACSASRR